MSKDIRLAFDNLEARAEADGGRDPLDRIALRDHVVSVEIGAFQAERGTTQRVRFSVVVEVTPPRAPLADDVDRILSYDTIVDAIQLEMAAERVNLLETLAERIAERILGERQAERVFVRIEKLDRGPGALGVEIVRSRRGGNALSIVKEDAAPHPLVVFLSNAAIASPHLSGWLDELEATGRPAVLCVGPADTPAPQSAAPAAQRRIDLLAMEQNAWVLAGRDPRCVVMRSRTELEWAARHQQLAVWAPSKIVLDAVDSPSAQPGDALSLVGWFCTHISARELLIVGSGRAYFADYPVSVVAPDSPALLGAR